MILKKDRYDKNFYDGDEMCIGCGTEFDALEEIIILGDVIGGGDNFICMDCAEVLHQYLSNHIKKDGGK